MSSRTPDGGYMPTFASNYMLDGFDFSEEYGEGVLTSRKVPTTSRTTGMPAAPRSESGLSHLPDGFVTGNREAAVGDDLFSGVDGTDVGDLSGLVKEAAHISDLSWLELAEQDPDRLPKQHNDKVLQGVVEAWGVNRRTDGVEVVPNVVVHPQPRSQVALLPGDSFREVVASAMRQSAFGEPLKNIEARVASRLGDSVNHLQTDPEFKKLARALRAVKAEHGIAGKVYLRDSAFPKLLTGKWDSEIKKKCASAHYWLTRPGSKLAAYTNYLGKRVVTEIPWQEALDHYRPTLEASGKRLASGDPKRVLLSALLSETKGSGVRSYGGNGVGAGDHHDRPVKRSMSASEVESQVSERVLTKTRDRVLKLARTGKLSEDQISRIISAKTPESMVAQLNQALYGSTSKSRLAVSMGEGDLDRHLSVREATPASSKKASTGGVVDPKVSQVLRYASVQMNEGAAGNDLDTMLASRFSQDSLKVAGEQLVQLRKKHEGLAGHVYIAADAYATSTGTTGCEKGGLIHRANQVKAVLQMERCGSCASNTNGHCQKYAKQLVASAPVENPAKYQRETIRLANSDDSERTASMFNAYDPGEFDLQNDNLDSFDYSNLPDNGTLHGILFEGMVLPEE
jgi:hypothetical protein